MSSNLCTEIVQYSCQNETAVCTLASVCLPSFVSERATFDFDSFHSVTKLAVRNTDRLIDSGHYPTWESYRSTSNSRAIGVGVQGLADVFMALKLPFDSPGARQLNVDIFETLYHAALEASTEQAKALGAHGTWTESLAHGTGLFFDLWPPRLRMRYCYNSLRDHIAKFGLRNSLLVAVMPTASTSALLGNSPSIEPYTR